MDPITGLNISLLYSPNENFNFNVRILIHSYLKPGFWYKWPFDFMCVHVKEIHHGCIAVEFQVLVEF